MNGTVIKEWAGCVIAIALVIGASAYALMRGSSVGADIQTLREAADTLNNSATMAPATVMDARFVEKLTAARKDFESRMRDSAKQGLVVTQLSEDARNSGLKVIEIQPRKAPGGMATHSYQLYRVTVEGSYQAIAAYMDGCKDQRIPSRVVELGMVPTSENDGNPNADVLRADITVEAFGTNRT